MAPAPDSTERFSERVADYVRFRPTYPEAVYRAIGPSSDAIIADVGSGTGLSAEIFLKHGNRVFGVEPNAAMGKAAEHIYRNQPQFVSVNGTAEATTLPDQSVDLIVAGQSFHWFDVAKAKTEFRRILRSGGRVALLWNSRRTDSTPFLRAYEDLLLQFGTDYKQINHQNLDRNLIGNFLDTNAESHSFENCQEFDWEGLQGRLRSCSYVPIQGQPSYRPMLDELLRIYQAHESNGKVSFEYDTELFIGCLT